MSWSQTAPIVLYDDIRVWNAVAPRFAFADLIATGRVDTEFVIARPLSERLAAALTGAGSGVGVDSVGLERDESCAFGSSRIKKILGG